jgi:hypothetical protein
VKASAAWISIEVVELVSPESSSVEPSLEAERTRYLSFSRANSQFQLSVHGIPGLTIPATSPHSARTSYDVYHLRVCYEKGHSRSENEAGIRAFRNFPTRIRSDSIHYVYDYSPCPAIDLNYGMSGL